MNARDLNRSRQLHLHLPCNPRFTKVDDDKSRRDNEIWNVFWLKLGAGGLKFDGQAIKHS